MSEIEKSKVIDSLLKGADLQKLFSEEEAPSRAKNLMSFEVPADAKEIFDCLPTRKRKKVRAVAFTLLARLIEIADSSGKAS